MTELALVALHLGISERTLRRGFAQGLFHGERLNPRRLRVPAREQKYLRESWWLLGQLRALLRTERSVRMAVLYGSRARGDARPDSDIDLLVAFADPKPPVWAVQSRLAVALERDLQIVDLEVAERSPMLLADVLEEGRVLVDRDRRWDEMLSTAPRVFEAAESAERALAVKRRDAVVEIVGRARA